METKKPIFVATKQLGPSGPPDHNRRSVMRWPTDGRDEIARFNASDLEKGWTERDDEALSAYLKVLNG